ncbi:MAG: serine O-acetyltransferase [Nitrospinae bacterium]|jgi:serine O-acetyltransferase|nr:serine O-acetyltransferase [Nitrospinota bacterium]MDA1108746.1 serine O-acetyltransferase [Nitrospinota bacterium]
MLKQIKEDVQVALEKDPSARNFWEVLFCYPGVHALIAHRISHWLWNQDLKFTGRILSFFFRWLTGIEIHPAAKIGRRFFIDHGMGVVIGETSEIGDNVFIYHGVTLGGLSMKKGKRHPTIEDNVVIGAGAQVLGPLTIGKNTKIGSGSVVLQNVPEYSTVIGVPGRVVFSGISADLESEDSQESFPDPVAQAIECMLDRLPKMEKEIRSLREAVEAQKEKLADPNPLKSQDD